MLFAVRMLIQAVAILLIAYFVPTLVTVASFWSAVAAAFVMGLVNTVVKPVFVILTLPLTLFTLGFFLLVINALLLLLVSAVVPGFEVNGFWGAVLGSLLISVVSWVLSWTVA